EGDVLDWEERWRRLNPEVEDDPGLPVRPAGASAAAVAGARAGVGVAAPDVYDPERIRAALRGVQARSGQPSRRANDPDISAPARSASRLESPHQEADSGTILGNGASRSASLSWDTTIDPAVTSTNGNHSAEHGSRGPFDAVFTNNTDSAERTAPAQAEDFSWLEKNTPESEPADSGLRWSGQADTGLAAPERTDFWAKPTTSASVGLQLPTPTARVEDTAIPRASWPAPADTTMASAAEPAHRAVADAASGAAVAVSGPAQPLSSTGSAAQATVGERDSRRPDRLFPARLLVVIVIAALIGSALVLLLM
ncbi:MAG: hypothetical protein ACRDOH_35175, partial [Streptosporangiaceae bacterium]